MTGIINFETFLLASLVLIITPGADTIYILSRSIAQGKKAGVLSALGVSVGLLVHTLFASLGLSAILTQSAQAFMIVKLLGAAYLIYLGIKTLRSRKGGFMMEHDTPLERSNRVFISGVLTNVLNPKVALFFLAFLPQFINPGHSDHFASLFSLGIAFTILGTIYCLFLAYYSAVFSHKIKSKPAIKKWMDRLSGLVFIGLGVQLALSKK